MLYGERVEVGEDCPNSHEDDVEVTTLTENAMELWIHHAGVEAEVNV